MPSTFIQYVKVYSLEHNYVTLFIVIGKEKYVDILQEVPRGILLVVTYKIVVS